MMFNIPQNMSSSKPIFALICFLTSITFLAQKVSSVNLLFHFCSKSRNYAANSPYEKNLKDLLVDLNSKTPLTGFSGSSIGQNPNRAHGLAQCRGDVSPNDCKSCVSDASEEIVKRCPYDKEAIVWYDTCVLKYSDNRFRGEIDSKYKFALHNPYLVNDRKYYNPLLREMFECLTEKALGVQNYYATKEIDIGDNEKLYGSVECTRDLSKENCKKCLDDLIINELPKCCDGKKGGRTYFGSCNLRYELYRFYT